MEKIHVESVDSEAGWTETTTRTEYWFDQKSGSLESRVFYDIDNPYKSKRVKNKPGPVTQLILENAPAKVREKIATLLST